MLGGTNCKFTVWFIHTNGQFRPHDIVVVFLVEISKVGWQYVPLNPKFDEKDSLSFREMLAVTVCSFGRLRGAVPMFL